MTYMILYRIFIKLVTMDDIVIIYTFYLCEIINYKFLFFKFHHFFFTNKCS